MNVKTLIQQLHQSSSRIHAALAGEYVRRFSHVPDDQLQRFERVMSHLMKKYPAAVYGELWLNAEGELVARSFEVKTNNSLTFEGYEKNALGDDEPVFGGVCLW